MEEIILNQAKAYRVCFSKILNIEDGYHIMDSPGARYHVLSFGHISEWDDKQKIGKSINEIDSYFNKHEKQTVISINKDNKTAKTCLLGLGFTYKEEWDSMFYVFDTNTLLKNAKIKNNKYIIEKVGTLDRYEQLLETNDFDNFGANWLEKLKNAFNQEEIKYIHYICFDKNKAIGISSLAFVDNTGYLMNATVTGEYRRKGIYNNLMIERATTCKELEVKMMILNTSKDNIQTNLNAQKIGYKKSFEQNYFVKER